MSSWSSYPSIFSVGHKAIRDLFDGEVNVEEKIDGSQFSFGLVDANRDDAGNLVDAEYDPVRWPGYALKIRSKGAVMYIDAPEKMFSLGAKTVNRLATEGLLHPGWTYRGEFLAKPKHNSLSYDRVPESPCPTCTPEDRSIAGCSTCNGSGKINSNVIIFDIGTGDQEWLSYADKKVEAERLGLECVPLLFSGRIGDVGSVREFFKTTSILGGQCIEGVVIKPVGYDLFGVDKKVLLGKLVSEAFKEVHRKAWGENNPTSKDIITQIVEQYRTPARWAKALIHLREVGKIHDDVTDIGPLIKAIAPDVKKECEDEIKEIIFKWAWPHIARGLTAGLPQWYKEVLLKRAFENDLQPEQVE